MKKTILKITIVFIIGAVGGVFADQLLWPYLVEKPLFNQYDLEDSRPVYLTKTNKVVIEENKALQEQVKEVDNTVVGIQTKTKTGTLIQGSGFSLTSDGLIVTLSNIIPRNSNYSFIIDEEEVSYQILKRDPETGLALVKLEKNDLSTVEFGEKPELGERVFLSGKIGTDKIYNTVNEGIVKAIPDGEIETNIFEDSKIDGSPLFNIRGQLIGINKRTSSGKVVSIPVSTIREFTGF